MEAPLGTSRNALPCDLTGALESHGNHNSLQLYPPPQRLRVFPHLFHDDHVLKQLEHNLVAPSLPPLHQQVGHHAPLLLLLPHELDWLQVANHAD